MSEGNDCRRVTNNMLYERLGAVTQLVSAQADELRGHRQEVNQRWGDDQKRFANLEAKVTGVAATLDRIKGPIETALSLKSFLLGLAALVSAIGLLVGAVHYSIFQRLVSLFYH
ncbi:MAG: hypothetical protein KGL39_03370 [Patescibacteria group bacterium]|nr:hypothetical protein [Patescibacteria group bacterium]